MRKKTKDRVAAATGKLPRLGGQGVLVRGGFVVTAAHCIGWTSTGGMVLGDHDWEPVRFGKQDFKLAPMAVEPVSDIAALGPMDDQACPDEYEQWEKLCETAEPLEIHTDEFPVFKKFPAYVLAHTGEWIECEAQKCNETAHGYAVQAGKQIRGGTSGGPVVTNDGKLLGVVSHCTVGTIRKLRVGTVYRPHLCLPPWLLRTMLIAS